MTQKVSKKQLKKKILQVLDIAPYLYENPEEVYLALLRKYPLEAVEICIKELKEEAKVELRKEEEFEWVEE